MRIVLIGPESTGKSTLCKHLAQRFSGICIDEYARTYTEQLQRPYTYEDVELIARKQAEQLSADYGTRIVFFDTDLIITKVWFEVKYDKCPLWVIEAMEKYRPDAYLVCMPDIKFEDDPVRENGNRREELLRLYIYEIQRLGVPYYIVSGQGDKRTDNAIKIVKDIARL